MSSVAETSESPEEDDIDEHTVLRDYGKLHRNFRKLIDKKVSKTVKNSHGEKHLSARYRITKYEPAITNSSLSIAATRSAAGLSQGKFQESTEQLATQTSRSKFRPSAPQPSPRVIFSLTQKGHSSPVQSTNSTMYPYRDPSNRRQQQQHQEKHVHHNPQEALFATIVDNIEQISRDSAAALKAHPPPLSLQTLAKLHTHRDFFTRPLANRALKEPAPNITNNNSTTANPKRRAGAARDPSTEQPPLPADQPATRTPAPTNTTTTATTANNAPHKHNFLGVLLGLENLLPRDNSLLSRLRTVLPEALECVSGNRHTVMVLQNWYATTREAVVREAVGSKTEIESTKKDLSLIVLLDLIRQSFVHCSQRGQLMLQTLSDMIEAQKLEFKADGDALRKQLKLDKEILTSEIESLKMRLFEMEEKGAFARIEIGRMQESLDKAKEREEELLALQSQ